MSITRVIHELDAFSPPVEPSVFTEHWMRILYLHQCGKVFTRPIFLGGDIPPPVDIELGESFYATAGKEVSLLVDLGCLTKEVQTEDVIFDDSECERLLEYFESGYRGLDSLMYCRYTVLGVPDWYMSLIIPLHPEHYAPDPLEALATITSLMGDE